MSHPVHVEFPGRLVIVGFGCIGQGLLPMILRHVGIPAQRVVIVTAEENGKAVAEMHGVRCIVQPLVRANYRQVLDGLLGRGDFLLNLSMGVSSIALVEYCWERGALYLDTSIEPWTGGYTDPDLPLAERTTYATREEALRLRTADTADKPTAIITHGANPGLVSHFVKQALLDLRRDLAVHRDRPEPRTRAEWAALAQALGVKVIHIAERDSQVSERPKQAGEMVNTWSIDGFLEESVQPAELGWGTHERTFPHDGRGHAIGNQAAIYLTQPGAATRVRTWTPDSGAIQGFLITHCESIAIADYYTVKDGDAVVYRPTTHFAYHPSDNALLSLHELAGRHWQPQQRHRVMMDEITGGMDELGVLLAGHGRNAYWYGSQLTIEAARRLAPGNNATSLQVAASALAGVVYAIENPASGLLEPDDLDHHRILQIAGPYLGKLTGAYTDWTPLSDRGRLFPEKLDHSDPWQFSNVRMS